MSMIAICVIIIAAISLSSRRRMDAAHRTQVLASSDPAIRQIVVEKKIQRGMTEQEVIASWASQLPSSDRPYRQKRT
jgi:hypothetical protein